jgi:hypothetical protein
VQYIGGDGKCQICVGSMDWLEKDTDDISSLRFHPRLGHSFLLSANLTFIVS